MINYNGKYKVVLLGEESVGKTSILLSYIKKYFIAEKEEDEMSARYLCSTEIINNRKINLEIWDLSGKKKFKNMIPLFLKSSCCIILVYDVNNKKTFIKGLKLLEKNKSYISSKTLIYIVGNKIDLYNNDEQDLKIFLNNLPNGITHFFTSSKTHFNIDKIFHLLVRELYNKNIHFENTITLTTNCNKTKSGCNC